MKKIIILFALLAVLLSSCNISNQRLANKMIEKYSDDSNYITLFGEVIKLNDGAVTIKCDELRDYITYEDELCDYHIFSNQIIELSVGNQIEFVTVPFHFYNGHKLPIVELKIGGNTFLSFEEGKKNLISWVNTTFK